MNIELPEWVKSVSTLLIIAGAIYGPMYLVYDRLSEKIDVVDTRLRTVESELAGMNGKLDILLRREGKIVVSSSGDAQ